MYIYRIELQPYIVKNQTTEKCPGTREEQVPVVVQVRTRTQRSELNAHTFITNY